MLHSLVVLVAEQAFDAVLVLEVEVSEDGVSLNDLVQDVEVQREFVHALNLLDKLPANRAANSEVMVEHLEALGTERVPAVDKDARNSLAHVELLSAIVAVIKASRPIITLYYDLGLLLVLRSLQLSLGAPSHLLERPVDRFLYFHTASTRLGLKPIRSLGRGRRRRLECSPFPDLIQSFLGVHVLRRLLSLGSVLLGHSGRCWLSCRQLDVDDGGRLFNFVLLW